MKITTEQLKAFRDLIIETERMHSFHHPECKDKGPNTCPTWEAIHGARNAVNAIHNQAPAEVLPDEGKLIFAMRDYGGDFASNLAKAWIRADGGNTERLREGFNNLLGTYRQFID